MCFSATASFSASAILIPVGIYCVKKSMRFEKPYWFFALIPLMFGIQQIFEGSVWLSIKSGNDGEIHYPALGFMFFSHLFWLIWIPLSCYVIEENKLRKKLFFVLIILGAAHGLSMYTPLWFNKDWLIVELVRQSIVYKAILIHDEFVPRIVMRILYALIVVIPLLISGDRFIRIFGLIILISVVISTVFYSYAFISIWCFFAAILSLYILYMIYQKARIADESTL